MFLAPISYLFTRFISIYHVYSSLSMAYGKNGEAVASPFCDTLTYFLSAMAAWAAASRAMGTRKGEQET